MFLMPDPLLILPKSTQSLLGRTEICLTKLKPDSIFSSWSRESPPPPALSVPTARDSVSYNLSGLKRVLVFNQKNFASRLKLNPRHGTEVDVRSIEGTFKSLDWEVTTYTDSTVAQIRDIILKEVINIDFNTQSSHITN